MIVLQEWIGFLLLPLSLFGTVCNWMVIILSIRSKSFKHAFGYLTANQAIGDALISTIFLFYISPMIITQDGFLMQYSKHFGFILVIAYDLSTHSHFLISLNRFLACYVPLIYEVVFSSCVTVCILPFTWLYSIVATIVIIIIFDCQFYYDPNHVLFLFRTNSFYCKTLTNKIRSVNRKITHTVVDQQSLLKRKRDMQYLKQTVLQGFAFSVELVTYFLISPHVSNKILKFMISIFAWCFIHATDGFLTIFFNSEFHRILQGKHETINRSRST
ncbi:unnamed protein product [Caenorhabditis bovis]|uniref:G-protein coupled receptors family 1 profile domain-containing protein n=1 Tax=Caenorhabditis bovis TaxID=2654633 RepID=A0A8S1E905_9PELO|nr:unnamed protein product [Caenorhabditis bovis]